MLFVDDMGMFDDEVASCAGVSQCIAGGVWRVLFCEGGVVIVLFAMVVGMGGVMELWSESLLELA